jgi:hypothetical protein
MGFLAPTTEELADNAMEKLRSGQAVSIVDAARKARLAHGLTANTGKIREITAELGRRSRAVQKAQRENAALAQKIGR